MSTNAQHTPWKGPLAVSISGAIIDATGIPVVYATGFHHAEAAAIVRAINLSDALLAALKGMAREEISVRENEEGEDYVTCPRCEATGWGGGEDAKDDIDHSRACVFALLAQAEEMGRERRYYGEDGR
jgi:hypothetical protein